MKVLLLILSAWTADMDPNLIGSWKYVGYEYDGNTYPLPNEGLDLRFTFGVDNSSTLKWFYEGEEGFCERRAIYEIQHKGVLYQKVTWVHPGNHFSCSKDPDMQFGKETVTKYSIQQKQLWLELELNGQPFIYILERLP